MKNEKKNERLKILMLKGYDKHKDEIEKKVNNKNEN